MARSDISLYKPPVWLINKKLVIFLFKDHDAK